MSTHPIPICPICYAPQTDPDPEKNPHRQNCANRSKKDMLADIEWFKTRRIKARNDAEFWQAKFHTLRLENNGLRRRLRKQSAPAPAPEPQWHNPEDYPLTAEEKADGWRFLTAGEATVPADAMFKYNHAAGMTRWSWDDAIRYEQITYFTRTPLPK